MITISLHRYSLTQCSSSILPFAQGSGIAASCVFSFSTSAFFPDSFHFSTFWSSSLARLFAFWCNHPFLISFHPFFTFICKYFISVLHLSSFFIFLFMCLKVVEGNLKSKTTLYFFASEVMKEPYLFDWSMESTN